MFKLFSQNEKSSYELDLENKKFSNDISFFGKKNKSTSPKNSKEENKKIFSSLEKNELAKEKIITKDFWIPKCLKENNKNRFNENEFDNEKNNSFFYKTGESCIDIKFPDLKVFVPSKKNHFYKFLLFF